MFFEINTLLKNYYISLKLLLNDIIYKLFKKIHQRKIFSDYLNIFFIKFNIIFEIS